LPSQSQAFTPSEPESLNNRPLTDRFLVNLGWANSKRTHSSRLTTKEGRSRLAIALLLYLVLSWVLIQDERRLGLSSVFAGFVAIYSGVIYKRQEAFAYVVGGVLLATAVIPTLTDAYETFKNGEWLGAVIILALGVLLWYWTSRMKAGEPPIVGKIGASHRRGRRSSRRA